MNKTKSFCVFWDTESSKGIYIHFIIASLLMIVLLLYYVF